MSTQKRQRNDLTIEQKKEILDYLRQSGNVTATAKNFKLTNRHIYQLRKKEKEILEAFYSSSEARARKRLRAPAGGSRVEVTPKRIKNEPGAKGTLIYNYLHHY